MPNPEFEQAVSAAADAFLDGVQPQALQRVEAKVSSRDGLPVLCAVEAVFSRVLPRSAAQELVWLNGAPPKAGHVLRLLAFGADNRLLAEAVHEF